MKNLLLLLLLIPVLACGQQKKVSDMPAATTVNDADLIMVVQGGANKKATKAVMQSEVNMYISALEDSGAIHLDTMQLLRNDINISIAAGLTNASQVSTNVNNIAKNVDSLEVHLDTLQVIRPDVNSNELDINVNTENIAEVDDKYVGVEGFAIDSVSTDTLFATWGEAALKFLLVSSTPDPEDPDTVTGYLPPHPAAINQQFMSHPNVVNDDDIGYCQVLVTDSIFNDRSTGAYSFSILTGNTGTAYKVNSSSGLIEVNSSAAVTQTLTLGIEVSHNSTAYDTVDCLITYRTGTEGTKLFYIDENAAGGGDGTFATPYNDISSIDAASFMNAGSFTILFARGGEYDFNQWQMYNDGDWNYISAYGSGALPIVQLATGEETMLLGSTSDPSTNDADSVWISDLRFEGSSSITDAPAIRVERYSTNIGVRRCEFYRCLHGNGVVYIRGVNGVNSKYKMHGCLFDENYITGGERAIKFEGGGLCEVINNRITDWWTTGMVTGTVTQNFGLIQYNLWEMTISSNKWEPAIQVRTPATINWNVTRDYYYGVQFERRTTDVVMPTGTRINGLIVLGDVYDGIRFSNDATTETRDWEDIIISDFFIQDPTNDGVRFDHSNQLEFTDVIFQKGLIVDAGGNAIDVNPAYINSGVKFYNIIGVGSTGNDIQSTTAPSASQLVNCIFDTKSHTWGTETSNYDIGVTGASPFVGSGDYTTAVGFIGLIEDQGEDIGYSKDILGNPISPSATDTDIGPFNYGGPSYNYTDR